MKLDGHSLTITQVNKFSKGGQTISIAPEALERVKLARAFVDSKVTNQEIVYGVTTGFGLNASSVVQGHQAAIDLQRHLVISHAVGVGRPLTPALTRAMMLIRLNTVLAGHSGVSMPVVELMLAMLNRDILPVVPSQGSVGASGDLCPLAHIACALMGVGDVFVKNEKGKFSKTSAAKALADANLSPVELSYKDGLALINGTTLMAALGALGVRKAEKLLKMAIRGTSLVCEALCSRTAFMDERVHKARRHKGQAKVAAQLRKYTEGSSMVGISSAEILYDYDPEQHAERWAGFFKTAKKWLPASADQHCRPSDMLQCSTEPLHLLLSLKEHTKAESVKSWYSKRTLVDFAAKKLNPQDAYSIRCSPQVMGASRTAIKHIESVISAELNAAVDNPLIFLDEKNPTQGDILSAGNFHGQPLALALDYLKIAVAELGNLMERQINKLTDPATNDCLPAFLSPNPGPHSGLMIVQYAAAALVSENKVLAHPASVDSIPTSANQEDHVSMGPIAGRQALEIIGNVEKIMTMHWLTAAQALDLRQKQLETHNLSAQMGKGSAKAYAKVREVVSFIDEDRFLHADIDNLQKHLF